MAYPSFDLEIGSKCNVLSGERVDRSENGFPRKRVLFDKEYYEFELKHLLNETDYNTLMTHYHDNRDATFEFDWIDGQTYVCEYIAPPDESPMVAGWRTVFVYLRSVS